MNWKAARSEVFNRGMAPVAFLDEMVAWARTAPDELFAPNNRVDIYNKVSADLGPWRDLLHRKAVMLEVLRVLAGFESSWNWREGIDTSRGSASTNENSEAGAWQASYDARHLDPSLKAFLIENDIASGIRFQQEIKFNHKLAMEFEVRLLRVSVKHNGPLYKGEERRAVWPKRPNLWPEKESIYPWLRRDAVEDFIEAITPQA